MFGTLLLLVCPFAAESDPGQPISLTGAIAKLAVPEAYGAYDRESIIVQRNNDWPIEETPRQLSDDGIPPTPAILNAQGCAAAISVFGTLLTADPQSPSSRTDTVHASTRALQFLKRRQKAVLASIKLLNEAAKTPPVDPEIAEILNKWEAASRETKTARLQLARTVCNLVFDEEKLADVELIYDGRNKVSLKTRPTVIQRGQISKWTDKSGRPFRLLPDHSEWRIWNADTTLIADDTSKSFESIDVVVRASDRPAPDSWVFMFRRAFSSDLSLPFLLEIRASQIQKNWSLELHSRKNGGCILFAKPASNLYGLSECWIMIDETTWQTTAVKYFDLTGNLETVYKVTERETNPVLPPDTFSPDWKSLGYTSVPTAEQRRGAIAK